MLNIYNRIESIGGAEYDGILSKAVDNETTQKIETIMLDGSVSIQVIGSPITSVDVEYYCKRQTRRQLQACAATGAPVVVLHRDKIWTGVISGNVIVEPYISTTDERLAFTILVSEENSR